MPSLTSKIVVGQRVHCRLLGLGDGIVFALTDTPSMRLCVDVVFDNGQISRAVPDTIVRGPQWDLLPAIEPPASVAEALADAAIMKAQRSVAASRAEDELAILQERLRRDPRFTHLQQGDDRASGKLAAGNVRRVLAASFTGIRFSVRREGYGTVNVSWTDGPTDAAVQAAIGMFRDGRFDGSDDLWRRDQANLWTSIFGGVEYLFTRRSISAALYERAITALWAAHPAELAAVERMTGEHFVARGSMLTVPGLDADLGVMIWRTASALSS